MGGKSSVGFKLFCSLVVKSFLACRQYGQAVVDTSSLMLAAEFPSFKGEPTMDRLTERFQLGLTEKEAALYMMGVINNAFENPRSIVYDEFQVRRPRLPTALAHTCTVPAKRDPLFAVDASGSVRLLECSGQILSQTPRDSLRFVYTLQRADGEQALPLGSRLGRPLREQRQTALEDPARTREEILLQRKSRE